MPHLCVCYWVLTDARSLSEDPATKVGVLEAGDWDPDVAAINLPGELMFWSKYNGSLTMRTGLAGSLMGHEKHDWGLVSVPQIHANGQQVPQPRYVHITRQNNSDRWLRAAQWQGARRIVAGTSFTLPCRS